MVSVFLAIGYGMVKIPVVGARITMKFLMGLSAAIANMFLAFPAMPTAARRANTALNGEFSIWKLGTFLGFLMAATELLVVPALAGIVTAGADADRVQLTKITPTISQHVPFAGYILIGLVTTNFLSLCHELGRNKVAKNDEVKIEKPEEKKDDGVSDFLTMFDSIRSFDSIAPWHARQLYKQIVQLTGERMVTPDEAKKLCALVENGEKNHIEQ